MRQNKPLKTATPRAKRTQTVKSRQVKNPSYRSFRLSKRIKYPSHKLPSSIKLFKTGVKHLLANKKLFLGIVGVYLLLTILFVKGLGIDSGLSELKESLEEIAMGGTERLMTGLTLFSLLVGTSGSPNSDVAGIYQSILLIVVSLALIWALRQTHAKNKISARDAFYKGLYPLVPFICILFVVSLQLLPVFFGATLYGIVTETGIAINLGEHILWLLLLCLLALLSLYMVSSSLFALYIVTLPDVRPMQALRSARELVQHRRWTVLRKVLFLPIILLVLGVIIMVPLILFVTPVAEWVFFVLTMLSLAVVQSYMYGLYRELLPDEK